MTRWKILRLKINLAVLIFVFWSCSGKESPPEQEFFFEISERKEFKIGYDGLYTSTFTPVFLDSSRAKGLIYNYLNHSLDSIFISADSAWSKTGKPMEYEGPFGVGRISSFLVWEDSIVLFTGSELFFKSIKTGEVRKKLLINYPLFKDQKFDHISFSEQFENQFLSLDSRESKAFFMIFNPMEKMFLPVVLDLNRDQFHKVPVSLDTSRLKELSFSLKVKNGMIASPDDPSIRWIGRRLYFTYPSFREILVFDLGTGLQQVFYPKSSLFPANRVLPEFGEDKMELNKAIDLNSEWQKQVSFGPLIYSEELELFYRFVKGQETDSKGKETPLFIEIFSGDMQKIGEKNLTEINFDLSRQYLQTQYGLMIKAKEQPNEDVMYYYNLNIRRSK